MTLFRRPTSPVSAVLLLFAATVPVAAEDYTIKEDASVFAVVTHKTGFASGMAHNHFIEASNYQATLTATPGEARSCRFTLSFATQDLVTDDPESQRRWFPALREAGILDKPYEEIGPKNREKIRQTMLSAEQLDASAFPKIQAEVTDIEEKTQSLGGKTYAYAAKTQITIHGVTKRVEAPVNITWKDGALKIEAAVPLNFTDFQIEPYTAFLGAVGNKDQFHIAVFIQADPAPSR